MKKYNHDRCFIIAYVTLPIAVIALKICHVIDWPWHIVLFPLMLVLGMFLAFIILIVSEIFQNVLKR